MEKLTAEQLAQACASFVNSYNPQSGEFIATMNREHRTLQQSFTRLALQWLENCASDEYRTDGRNESSHNVAKIMVDSFKEKKGAQIPGTENMPPSSWLNLI